MPESIAALIPHRGAMCLLEELVRWDSASVTLHTMTHRSAQNPLRDSNGRLRGACLCEYGAQAMAVHGALTARAAGGTARPGFLVSLRGVELHCDDVQEIARPLEVTATQLLASDASWQYAFRVQAGSVLLAEGRAAVVARPASED